MKVTKGRSLRLIEKRNRKLAVRFYWYSSVLNLKFSKCLEELENEFDISQSRICDLLTETGDLLSTLEQNKTSVKQLQQLYPFMAWTYRYATPSPNSLQLSLDLF